MKTAKIFFWIVTIIFSAFMLFSGISEIMQAPDGVKIMEHLGYPNYLTPFLGYAKILGVIALLVPADFPKIKEWAYAGFFFDLVGAAYSGIAVDGFQPPMLFMILFFAFLFTSYFLYHRIREGNPGRTKG
jgi:hypothetical protein